MFRSILSDLVRWKNASSHKPLILKGARQVGKTWIMRELGRTHYEQTVYINFEKTRRLKEIFDGDLNVNRIITALQIETGITITPDNTLIILDEIQEVPASLTALKYFSEEAPNYHIIAAGSLLGVALHTGLSFPVGKVEFINMYPMTFNEFLVAVGEKPLDDLLKSRDWQLIKAFKERYIERLKHYYYIGGMPEAVMRFSQNNDFTEVREIQHNILDSYEYDFSKHAPSDIIPRIRMVWNSIPGQLAKENRKFIYRTLKQGARAKDYEAALSWLTDCGQTFMVHRVAKPAIPLKAYEEPGAFKLFMTDTGLMSAMCNIDVRTLLEGNKIFTEFKGALTEQYVYQQVVGGAKFPVFYWSAERSTAEVDFLLQFNQIIVPLEVKSEENLQSKSLKTYNEKFAPAVSVRTSMSDFREQEWMVNLPLYAISEIGNVIEECFRKKKE